MKLSQAKLSSPHLHLQAVIGAGVLALPYSVGVLGWCVPSGHWVPGFAAKRHPGWSKLSFCLFLPGCRVAGPICILLFAFLTLFTSQLL